LKKLLILGFIFSFSASAKSLCFQVETDYPVAIDVTVTNFIQQTKLERYEIVPFQYFCKSYSNFKTRNLKFEVHGFDEECMGTIKTSRDYTLIIRGNGCLLKTK